MCHLNLAQPLLLNKLGARIDFRAISPTFDYLEPDKCDPVEFAAERKTHVNDKLRLAI